MNLPTDPKALEIIEKGKKFVRIMEREELSNTGDFRRALDDFANLVKWAEDNPRRAS